MKKPTIDISIGKDGQVRVKVHGVSGKECTNLADAISRILGGEQSRKLTSEYFGGDAQIRTGAGVESNVRHT